MTKDEKAADEWQKQREWISSGKLSKDEASIGFLAGCAHKEERYARLVEVSRHCRGAYQARSEQLWTYLDQLDEILKEVGDG